MAISREEGCDRKISRACFAWHYIHHLFAVGYGYALYTCGNKVRNRQRESTVLTIDKIDIRSEKGRRRVVETCEERKKHKGTDRKNNPVSG
jgi:hypothetical protein